jgi:hypothetical protein
LFTGQQYVDIHLAQPNYCCWKTKEIFSKPVFYNFEKL